MENLKSTINNQIHHILLSYGEDIGKYQVIIDEDDELKIVSRNGICTSVSVEPSKNKWKIHLQQVIENLLQIDKAVDAGHKRICATFRLSGPIYNSELKMIDCGIITVNPTMMLMSNVQQFIFEHSNLLKKFINSEMYKRVIKVDLVTIKD